MRREALADATVQDARLLEAFAPLAASHIVRITYEFFQQAGYPPSIPPVLLRRSLEDWMTHLLSGAYNPACDEEVRSVVQAHAHAGLSRSSMVAWMALVHVELARVADWLLGRPCDPIREVLERRLDLQLTLVGEAYASLEPAAFVERRAKLYVCV